ncbi:MAG: hypothetical protein M1834_000170 [Cirrosporium novae-zelandiae]|nr:MAG: hypothetical protein M1834_000170 [Cirrosporium novae-zelandiae]
MTSSSKAKSLLRLNRPFNQNIVVGCVLFLTPGIYLALTGLGAGGGRPSSQDVASTTNAILYGLFTLFGWAGGSILNLLGPRLTLATGCIGYPLYVGSLWYFDRVGNKWFPYFGGAILGVTAGILWTTAGFVQFAYATETEKAKFITWQWALTCFGGTVGSFIAFGCNFHQTAATGVSTPVYIVFIVLMLCAIAISLIFVIDPRKVVRDDGTHIAIFKQAHVWTEIKGVFSCFMDLNIIIMLPAIFVGEMNLALMSSINCMSTPYYFNLRTRSLNNVMFQFIEIPVPLALAYIMDCEKIKSRRLRGMLGLGIMGVITMGTNAGLATWIVKNDINQNHTSPAADWTSDAFGAGFILYLLSGIIYAGYQIVVQWVISALTNDPVRCARYSGMYKGTTSLGMCISFVLDSKTVPYIDQLIVQFVIYGVGLCCVFCIIWFRVKETNYFAEDDVIVPHKFAERALIEGIAAREQVEKEELKERIAEGDIEVKDSAVIIREANERV